MLGEDRALELLQSALEGGEADALEGYLEASQSAYTRLANAEIVQDSTVDDARLIIRADVGGRLGTVTTNDLTPEGIRRARRSATEVARSLAAKPFPQGFLDDRRRVTETAPTFDERTARLSAPDRRTRLSGPLAAARKAGLLLAGNYHTGIHERAILNTLGLVRYYRNTRAEANLIALEGLDPGLSTGYAGGLGTSVDDLDLDDLAATAIRKSLDGRNPVELTPGTYDVILEPAAVSELLEWLGFIGFSSRSVEEKLSFMAGRLGERVTGPRVTLIDDGHDPEGFPVPFDAEGTAKKRTVLISEGVANAHVFDREHAHRVGCASTGHAVAGDLMSESSALPTNLFMAPGNEGARSLIESVERGLWITRFHYVNGMLEPRRAVMTGLTRDGTFLIEDGRLSRGVRTLRFTDSVLEAFERIDGLTADRRTIPTWWSGLGAVTAPTVLIRGLRFSS